jgi:hypothetical protein
MTTTVFDIVSRFKDQREMRGGRERTEHSRSSELWKSNRGRGSVPQSALEL